LREFDEACLSVPELFQAKDIKKLREQHLISQPIFARYLNTTE
jgi:putative transcriptional regulator